MRIGIVGWEMEGEATGVGRVLQGFLQGLSQTSPEGWIWDLHFQGRSSEEDLTAALPKGLEEDPRFRRVVDRHPETRSVVWEQTFLARRLQRSRPDLIYSPGYSLPLASGCPGVLTLHDLSFESRGHELRFRERWRRRLLARWSARRAVRVLADTRRGAEEIASTYAIPPAKVGVVPLGISERFHSEPMPGDEEMRRSLGLPDRYVLHLGSIFPRRHVPEILTAFEHLADHFPDVHLVLAGADHLPEAGALDRAVESCSSRDRVFRMGWVADEVVPALYRGATASLYLSEYEGYGLPPLESLASGTLPLVGPGLALDEIWPDYPFRVHEGDLNQPSRIAESLERLLEEPSRRDALRQEGIRRMGDLSWNAAAATLCAELERAATS